MNYQTQQVLGATVAMMAMAMVFGMARPLMFQAGQTFRVERTTVEKVLDPLEETWHRIASDMNTRMQAALDILKEVMGNYFLDKAVVAWDNHQLVGIAVYETSYDRDFQCQDTYIQELASFTHKPGVGKLLVEEVIRIAREEKSDTVMVTPVAGAEKFYEGLGFKKYTRYPEDPYAGVHALHLSQVEQPTLVETKEGLSVFFPGERASATLSWLDPQLFPDIDLGPGKWLWFNRLINQSGKPRLGTALLDAVLAHCEKNRYSILNEVSAYGLLSQQDLENWYMSKGFKPVDYKKYGNALLVWRPTK